MNLHTKTSRPDVSVIIPTYNYGHFIEECIQSVYRQRNVDTEIIVVDDGSTDNTKQVLKPHAEQIQYIYQTNKGLSAARNTGLRASAGRYIQFLDADDLLGPDCLVGKMQFLEKVDNRGIAVCRSLLFSKLYGNRIPNFIGWWWLFQNNLEVHLCRLNVAPPHAYMLSKEIADAVGFFNESMKGCEDYDYWLRALGKGFRPRYSSKGIVYYRKHSGSMGATKKRAGGLPFDVLVHEKKHNHEYGTTVSTVLGTVEGVLAFCDGLIFTALKVNEKVNYSGKMRLITLAKDYLNKFFCIKPETHAELSTIAHFYLVKLYNRNRKITAMGDKELDSLFNEIGRFIDTRTIMRNIFLDSFPFSSYDKQISAFSSLRYFVS